MNQWQVALRYSVLEYASPVALSILAALPMAPQGWRAPKPGGQSSVHGKALPSRTIRASVRCYARAIYSFAALPQGR